MVQILDYSLVASGLSHVLTDSVDIVSDLFVCLDHQGGTPQRLPVDLFAAHHRSQPELCDSRPYRRLIIGHGDHHHRHLIIEDFVDAVHAAMRDEKVSVLKDGQLVYRLVDENVMRNPAQFCLVEITAHREHYCDISISERCHHRLVKGHKGIEDCAQGCVDDRP